MIVTIHPSVANRYPTLDPDFRVQVFQVIGLPAWQIKGHQLIAAGVHTIKSKGEAVRHNRWYYLALKDVVPVDYSTVSFNENIKGWYPKARLSKVMRVQGYDEDGDPLLLVSDVIEATCSIECIAFAYTQNKFLVPLNPEYITFNRKEG